MEAIDKLTRARVTLERRNPFYAYLSMYLKFADESSRLDTIGVDMRGNVGFNKKFIESKTNDEIVGLLCHEIGHIVFEHGKRRHERNHDLFNIAGDIVINETLRKEGIALPADAVYGDGKFKSNGKWVSVGVKDVSNKTTEQVYEELKKRFNISDIPVHVFCVVKEGSGDAKMDGIGQAIRAKGVKAEGEAIIAGEITPENLKELIVEAYTYAKLKGRVPLGMDRQLDNLLTEKINWKSVLYKYITNEIPIDFNWSYPSKRSIATGIYMPSIKRETIDIIVSIDTSGSIDQKQLTEFTSEIVAIAKSFNSIRMTLIVADAQVHETMEIANGNIARIGELKMKGGGGTAHEPVYKWIQENKPNAKLLVAFTDGYTSYPEYEKVKTLWVLSKDYDVPWGDKVVLTEGED